MKLLTLFIAYVVCPAIAYECSIDGIPTVILEAGQGPQEPSLELAIPFADSCDNIGEQSVINIDRIIPGPIKNGLLGVLPNRISFITVISLGDKEGNPGTEAVANIVSVFDPKTVTCTLVLIDEYGDNVKISLTIGSKYTDENITSRVNNIACFVPTPDTGLH